ncbi:hypothetical protein ACEQ8H_002695 [Pleosporales sp. CAS-2024a]
MLAKLSMVALCAGLVAAQHAPVGDPSGNPITRPLNEIVAACVPFTITWQPTTSNSVSLILLRGPSTNIKPLSTLVTGIPNSGSFVWTPSSSLEADTTHYGLQLIDDVTGQYQYSTQFGISKDAAACHGVAASSAASSPYNGGGGYPVSTPASSAPAASSAAPSSSSIVVVVPTSSPKAPTTIATVTAPSSAPSSGYPAPSSILLPTKSMTVPASLKTTATAPVSPTKSLPAQSTGAAAGLQAGLGFVGAAAAMAFML